MSRTTKNALILILAVFLGSIILFRIMELPNNSETGQQIGEFEVLSSNYMFDTGDRKIRLIQRRVTGECYLFSTIGNRETLAKTECIPDTIME